MKIAKEQINDLKKKLSEVDEAKSVAEWARDEALRAKTEVEFARTEAESSKEKVEEEAYDLGVAETQATLKAQILRVCRPSNRLGLRLHSICGRWRRYTILRPSVRPPLSAPRL